MRDKERQDRRKSPGGNTPELRVVGIDLNPAPDAEDRLRRLFTILAGHFAGEGANPPVQEPPPDADADIEGRGLALAAEDGKEEEI